MKKLNILVTGGAGFIGSHTVDALIKLGHSVTVADNLITGKQENINSRAQFINCDITNKRQIERVFKYERYPFDVVYHFAAHMNVRESVDNPVNDAEVNILGSLNVLDLCQKYNAKKLIFSSSGGTVYGAAKVVPTNEEYSLNPICPYGLAKMTVEKYMEYYRKAYGMDIVILRYANVYGKRQNSKSEAGVISIFLDKMSNNENPIMFGDGNNTRDFIYIDDIVDINIKSINGITIEDNRFIYNVGTGKETSINWLFDIINSYFGHKFLKKYTEVKYGEIQYSCLCPHEIMKKLEIKKFTKITEGIEKLF